MQFRHVFLLLKREIRDQLRDRRMLFMIFVLPLLLYPLMGMMFFQTGQFTRQTPSRVLVLMPENVCEQLTAEIADEPDELSQRMLASHLIKLSDLPPLFTRNDDGELSDQFDESLFDSAVSQRLLQLQFESYEPQSDAENATEKLAQQKLDEKNCDVVLVIPPELFDSLHVTTDDLGGIYVAAYPGITTDKLLKKLADVSQTEVFYTSSNQKSPMANSRLRTALNRWNELLGEFYLKRFSVDPKIALPLEFTAQDTAAKTEFQGASFWSKFLPVILLLWALTGAFYPSVDLCAGEKERGTLETLLSSPAGRGEIVLSKLLTIMTFSVLTSMLNILCVGATAYMLVSQLEGIGLPPRLSMLWLTLALIPTSALFSALCIALASYAKSSKEGQYYLTPLMLVVMPLVMVPMAPGQELNLGMALIPVSGIVLTLSSLIEGDYLVALQHLPIVLLVTLGCCVVSVRWAVDQFNSEAVLFRESEKFNLQKWLQRLLTTRVPKPTPQAAILCGIAILSLKYFATFVAQGGSLQAGFVINVLFSQFCVILLPVVVLVAISSSSVWQTLRLSTPRWWAVPFAVLLALCWHPILVAISQLVMHAYPFSDELRDAATQLGAQMADIPVWLLLVLVAVLPGFCEEITFRGYILTGLDTKGHRLRAILLTSIFFGITHSILQQSLLACTTGIVLAWLAIQTRSIWPGVAFHVTNNAIGVLLPKLLEHPIAESSWFRTFIGNSESITGEPSGTPGLLYGPFGVIVACLLFAGCVFLFVVSSKNTEPEA